MKKKFKYLFWLCMLIVGVVTIVSLHVFQVLVIKNIDCKIDDQDCSPEITDSTQALVGKSLFFTNFEAMIKDHVLDSHPGVSLVSFTKTLNGQLAIKLSKSQSGFWVSDGSDQKLYVNQLGQVDPEEEYLIGEILVVLPGEMFDQLIQEKQLNAELAGDLVEATSLLNRSQVKLNKVGFLPPELLILYLPQQIQIVLPLNKLDMIVQIPLVIKYLKTQELTQIREIDLRFKLPVLRDRASVE